MNALLQDLRYAVRMLVKTPGFTAAAVLTLALGLTVNAVVFLIVSDFFLRPLPAAHPERLVVIAQKTPKVEVPNGRRKVAMDATRNGALIHLENLTKVFQTDEVETHALAGVHLEIHKGDYVAISGPSGCGKSTLLSILGLLDSPSAGAYRLNGQPVGSLKAGQRARIRNREIGFIFQSFNLIGDLTVSENVELPLTYRGLGRAERRQRVGAALDKIGMSHRAKHYPSQLSGGQQQRVAVARALVGEPSILLADEPTGNLDSKNGEAVMELLSDLHRGGATICMVTHDVRFARHADRTIHLFDGQIVDEEGHPDTAVAAAQRG